MYRPLGMIYIATYIRKLKDRSGNYITPATRAQGVYFSSNQTLDDLVFPVGFIYQSTSSTSPASLYGGSWERIQGRFLLGTSSSYTVSSTGGEENHILTVGEIPAHHHGFSESVWVDTGIYDSSDMHSWMENENQPSWKADLIFNTNDVGENQPHNNMPPYYAVNIWRRTA